jgi:hypothetical protein
VVEPPAAAHTGRLKWSPSREGGPPLGSTLIVGTGGSGEGDALLIKENDVFLRWLDRHQDGFVVNMKSGGETMVHRASCARMVEEFHSARSLDFKSREMTNFHSKLCEEDLAGLRAAWRKRMLLAPLPIGCKTCKPFQAPPTAG